MEKVWSSFLNIGITFATFKLSGKLPVENDKFLVSEIGLLRVGWRNNFKNLLGILAGPVDLLLLNYFITNNTLLLFVGNIKKELVFGLFIYL